MRRIPVLDSFGRAYATGRRKTAVARVWVAKGSGKVTVNRLMMVFISCSPACADNVHAERARARAVSSRGRQRRQDRSGAGVQGIQGMYGLGRGVCRGSRCCCARRVEGARLVVRGL
jgi:hypothetical protein